MGQDFQLPFQSHNTQKAWMTLLCFAIKFNKKFFSKTLEKGKAYKNLKNSTSSEVGMVLF